MKKIPVLFKRVFENHKVLDILPEVTDGLECVLEGKCVATVKIDGSCCAIINGELYKRYDAKKGKKAPVGAIPCCEADPVTGHHPHWVKCNRNNPSDKWFFKAFENMLLSIDAEIAEDGTYEAVGKHFQTNPYHLPDDILIKHGKTIISEDDLVTTFEGIRDYLHTHYIEGIVFWKDGEPLCKIRRKDFGFHWGR